MKQITIYITFALLLLFALSACSKVNEEVTSPVENAVSVHPEGIGKPGSENFHGVTLMNDNWDLEKCRNCHGADLSGGITGESCLTCHSQPAGPQACNTCHGVFGNPERIAPPNDLAGNTDPSAPGVGAHAAHLYDNESSPAMSCRTCHNFSGSGDEPFVESHIDGLPAEMDFAYNALLHGADPSYDFSTHSCSDTYCHGNFSFSKENAPENAKFIYTADVMTGLNQSPVWNSTDGSFGECGTACHALPPAGHIQTDVAFCGNCHGEVVDNNGNIINSMKHANGKINVYGNEY